KKRSKIEHGGNCYSCPLCKISYYHCWDEMNRGTSCEADPVCSNVFLFCRPEILIPPLPTQNIYQASLSDNKQKYYSSEQTSLSDLCPAACHTMVPESQEC